MGLRVEPIVRLDLHIHTTASDGAWSPEAVVSGAVAGGLDVIAVTDHDTSAAFEPARSAARGHRLQVLPGIEVSSTYQGQDVHVLGYFVDPSSPAIEGHARRASRRRKERMREMLHRLKKEGVDIGFAQVEEAAGPDRVVIGRPHLAQALVAGGHAASIHDAFNRLIGDHCRAFVPTQLLDPMGAVDVVLSGGGVPIWAHPPGELVDALLPPMLEAGLRGLEVYRPRNRRPDTLRLEALCRSRGLLATGGSDWHSPDGGTALGDFHVTADEVEGLLAARGM